MNCESCEEPKNSLIAELTGRTLIRDSGVISLPVGSKVDILSLITLSSLVIPILNWFCNSSPTERTRRLPRWSILSIVPIPLAKSIFIDTLATRHVLRNLSMCLALIQI